MAKKKDKQQVINNIQELNLEIDYDKLVDAIKKAQNVATINVSNLNEDEEIFAGKVLKGKIPKGRIFSSTLSKLMESFFNLLAITSILAVFSLALFIGFNIYNNGWNDGIVFFRNIYYIFCFLIVFVFEIFFFRIVCKIAEEIGQEQDKNYIVSAFSCVVSLMALIVALVALFKGVG